MKGMLSGLLSLISLIIAGLLFWMFQSTPNASSAYMIGAVVFAILMVVFGVMFLSGRVNKTEDIHITE